MLRPERPGRPPLEDQGLGLRAPLDAYVSSGGDDWTSQVPGGTPLLHALLSDPGGTLAQAIRASVWPSAFGIASAPAVHHLTGLNHTAYSLAVYASQPGLPQNHARLASGWWPALPGRIGYLRGPLRKVSVLLPYIPSSLPRLGLAHTKR